MSSRRARSGGSITRARRRAAPAAPASNLPSAARLPSGSALVADERRRSSLLELRQQEREPLLLRASSTGRSRRSTACRRALPRSAASGFAVSRASVRPATTTARPASAARAPRCRGPVPGSPRIRHRRARGDQLLERALGVADRRRSRRAPRARRAAAPARARRLQRARDRRRAASAGRSAFRESRTRRCFVASTAVSIVPWPDIMTTGIVSWPARRPFAQQRDAVGVRHPDVEQHQRRLLPLRGTRAPRSRSRRRATR